MGSLIAKEWLKHYSKDWNSLKKQSFSPLEIIYKDEFLVAINKPHGLLTHRTSIAVETDEFALQLLRDQIGQKVYPIHRLDRKTSGILLFALNPVTNKFVQDQIRNHTVIKSYVAIVRGFFPDKVEVDYPVINARGKLKDASTAFKCIGRTEIDVALGKHQTSRYSLIEAFPKTGRMHQIRRHLNHLRHPIIGDRPHGCSKQNRLFKEKWNMTTMMLHAKSFEFMPPGSQKRTIIEANCSCEFVRMKKELNLS